MKRNNDVLNDLPGEFDKTKPNGKYLLATTQAVQNEKSNTQG